ncbi:MULTISPECIES: hypothetical protein [Methylomonas]|nr:MULTISPECIES: hypothetical protein [Methylomonas]ANE53721.1 hypothetical protein AYM39_00010 [Methylomonas sp. DH-1]OAI16646.1 hypothetical protein A1507_11610 [Methylomonas koyamae]
MKRHLLSGAIFLAATALYLVGYSQASAAAAIAGGMCEAWFWLRMFDSSSGDGGPAHRGR